MCLNSEAKRGKKKEESKDINISQPPSKKPGHLPPSFCHSHSQFCCPLPYRLYRTALLPVRPVLPTAISYKNFSVSPHVVCFLRSCVPLLTWCLDYWVVTGPLNDGWKISRCRQYLALINSILSGPCAVVRAALHNRCFDAWVNIVLCSYAEIVYFGKKEKTKLPI